MAERRKPTVQAEQKYRYDLLGAEVQGLKLRHVKSLQLMVEWDDSPPEFIEEERLGDIVRALRRGFEHTARAEAGITD